MAQFVWDKSGLSAGQAVTNWADGGTGITLALVDEAGADNQPVLQASATDAQYRLANFTPISATAEDIEVLARVKGGDRPVGVSGAVRPEVAIYADNAATNALICEYQPQVEEIRAKSQTPFGVIANTASPLALGPDDWYWQRSKVERLGGGDFRIRIRVWTGLYADEPATWQVDYTGAAANIPASGLIGFHLRLNTPQNVFVDYFAVGTAGDVATGPGGTPPPSTTAPVTSVSETGGDVTVSWTLATDPDSFRVERRSNSSDMASETWTSIATPAGTARSFVDDPGPGHHQYRVFAVTGGTDSDASNVVEVDIAIPDPAGITHHVWVWAHQDDEILCSVGSLHKYRDAENIVVIMTDGEGSGACSVVTDGTCFDARKNECIAALGILGVTDVRFLGFDNGGATPVTEQNVSDAIDEIRRELPRRSRIMWHGHSALDSYGGFGAGGHPEHVIVSNALGTAYAAGKIQYLRRYRLGHTLGTVQTGGISRRISSAELPFAQQAVDEYRLDIPAIGRFAVAQASVPGALTVRRSGVPEIIDIPAAAPGASPEVSYSGTVVLSGSPVSGAVVSIINQQTNRVVETVTTGASGEYSFTGYIAEPHHLVVEYESGGVFYRSQSKPFVSGA